MERRECTKDNASRHAPFTSHKESIRNDLADSVHFPRSLHTPSLADAARSIRVSASEPDV